MEAVRAWALSVCLACVAAGVLQQLAVSRARFSVIKLVLTLYILITAFAPLSPAAGKTELPQLETEPVQAAVDVQALALDTAQKQLEQQVRDALQANGVQVSAVEVTLVQADASAQLTGVRVVLKKDADGQNAEQLVQRVFDAPVPVTLEQEG